jgi:hypothetical protein
MTSCILTSGISTAKAFQSESRIRDGISLISERKNLWIRVRFSFSLTVFKVKQKTTAPRKKNGKTYGEEVSNVETSQSDPINFLYVESRRLSLIHLYRPPCGHRFLTILFVQLLLWTRYLRQCFWNRVPGTIMCQGILFPNFFYLLWTRHSSSS